MFFILFILNIIPNSIHIVKVDTSINPASAKYIISSLNKANKEKANLFVIELNTPGGLVKSTRDIVRNILNSKVPVAVNVTPSGAHAGSAGVMITLSANVAAMAPGTNIGAAHPVSMFSNFKDKEKNVSQEKAVNDISSFVKSIAVTRNRNSKWAQNSVLNNSTLIPSEALSKNVIDFVVKDTSELINILNNYQYTNTNGELNTIMTQGANIIYEEMSFKDRIINFFADPNFAFFLMVFAALGLYLEFSHPGLILPGIVSGISFILFLMSIQILPITATGSILIFSGLALIISELFITSGFLGLGGSVSIILGGIFFIDPMQSDLKISSFVLWSLGLFLIVSVLFITYLIYKSKKRKISKGVSSTMGVIASDELVLAEVVEFDNKKKTGKVIINSEYWNFKSDDLLKKGDLVTVNERKGLTLKGGKING